MNMPRTQEEMYEDLFIKAEAAVKALAHRWTIVDCTLDEERAIRELNDILREIKGLPSMYTR